MKQWMISVMGCVCLVLSTFGGEGNALEFEHDGAQYADIPLTLPDVGTIELWYKPESLYNYNTVFDNAADANDWEMWIYESGDLRFRIEDGDLRYDLNEDGNANDWHHIAVTWQKHDTSLVDYDLWLNGTLRSALTNATWIDPGDTFYLAGGHSGNDAGDGLMDEVRIWSDVRTESEIANNMYNELNGNEEGLLAYYPMNQSAGTNLTDAASGSYDGTLVNMSNSCWVVANSPTSTGYVGEPFIKIATEDATVRTNVTTYTIEGTNNRWVAGKMEWLNGANSASGEFSVSDGDWEVSPIPLASGENKITVSGTNVLGDAISDVLTITQGGTRAPDIGNIQWLEVGDRLVDTQPDAQLCSFSDGDSHMAAVLYKGLNDDGFVNIRLRTYEVEDGTLTPTGFSKLMSDDYSENLLTKPRMVALDDYTVLITWADIVRDDDMEDFIFKGMIYNIKTEERGDVFDLNEMFSCRIFCCYMVTRVGQADDNKVLLIYNYNTQSGSLDNYFVKGQLLSYEGTNITLIGEAADLYTGTKYRETVGAEAYSFANDDRFMVLYIQEDPDVEKKFVQARVFQLDDSETNGYTCVNDQLFYTSKTSSALANIYISGPHGDSVAGATKFMASWENRLTNEDYAVVAHLTSDHQLVVDSTLRFDSSVPITDFARHHFVENQEYAWVIWKTNSADIDTTYTLLDFRADPPVPVYSPLELYRPSNERYWCTDPKALPNGDVLFAVEGDSDLVRNWVRLYYVPVPSVSLTASDTEGGEFGDTDLAFTLTQKAESPSYLEVEYTVGGTASNGVDISRLAGIKALAESGIVKVQVLPDNESEGDETLSLQLQQGPGYKIGASTNATVIITDRPMQDYLFHLVSDPALSAPDGDADGDGVLNIDEYYMGTSPTNDADHAGIIVDWDAGFKFRYPRAKERSDVSATFTWCRDLSTNVWYNSGESDGSVTVSLSESVISDPSDNPETVEILVESAPTPRPDTIFVRMTIQ